MWMMAIFCFFVFLFFVYVWMDDELLGVDGVM